MTERRYFTSDLLGMQAEVLCCSPVEGGKFEVVLASTLFHPQGGGQPSDQGTIDGAKVLRVMQIGDELVHLVDREVAIGQAFIAVDAESRSLHARLHSAGHLIGFCGEQSGWRAVKGHHWPGEARVVFEEIGQVIALESEILEQQVNGFVKADLVRTSSLEGDKRMVGFGHLPAYSCGGTHVRSSSEIGKVRILRMKQKKGLLSINYDVNYV